jgi:hypothetical protein
MVIAVVSIVWFFVWLEIQPSSAFRIALAPIYVVSVNIMICRVFRNTKLGLYSKVPVLQSNDFLLETHTARNGSISWNSRLGPGLPPIQISVNKVVERKSDYRPAEFLDFGMV